MTHLWNLATRWSRLRRARTQSSSAPGAGAKPTSKTRSWSTKLNRRLILSPLTRYTHSKPARGPRRIYLQDRQAPLSEFNLHRCSCDTPGLEQRRATSRAVVGELPIHLRAYDKAVYMTESLESLNAKESASRMDANTTRPMRQLQLTSARPYTFQCY